MTDFQKIERHWYALTDYAGKQKLSVAERTEMAVSMRLLLDVAMAADGFFETTADPMDEIEVLRQALTALREHCDD